MLAPLSWLRDFAPLQASTSVLAATLSELGLVVEGIEEVGAGLDGVVVARIAGIRKHPSADRIRLVDVDAGGAETLQIACGAWNFEVGDLVPLAPVGAVLPGGFEISRRKMRGEWSDGMLCSAPELGLPQPGGAEDGLMILQAGIAVPGTPLMEALDLHADVVFDLDVSPNRPDALCMAGIARDLAGRLGETWSIPSSPPAPPIDASLGRPPITIEAGDLCARFTGTILEGVPDGPSPTWMARRLALAGMRPINAVVDVSNYVMLDLGQPNHAYDLERLGGGGILVRRAKAGETLVTLDGVDREVGPDDCLICDVDGLAVGVAGVMGGADTEIAGNTRRVLLEAAWFTPMAIARTGKRLGLHSEARVRFERGVDPQVTPAAIERFLGLLSSVPGGEGLRRGPTVDVIEDAWLPRAPVLQVRTGRVNSILGTTLDTEKIAGLIESIGFTTEASEGGLTVAVPSWRLDTEREIDVVEEVARMWGYSQIARSVPSGASGRTGGLTRRQLERRRIRDVLAGAGFDEAWTTTFLAPGDLERAGLHPDAVEVENPLDRSESILRTSLLPGLLKAVRFNRDRQGGEVCLFEVGHVFAQPRVGPTPDETEFLAAIVAPAIVAPTIGGGNGSPAVAAARTWRTVADALRLSATTLVAGDNPGLHPTRSARIVSSSGATLGSVGEVDSDVVNAYGLAGRLGFLTLSLDALAGEPRLAREAHLISRFPASDFDLAFVVGESVAANDVLQTLRNSGGDLLEAAWLFDVFRGERLGEARKSLAYRLRYRADDRTLDEAELAEARTAAIEAVAAAHGAALRG